MEAAWSWQEPGGRCTARLSPLGGGAVWSPRAEAAYKKLTGKETRRLRGLFEPQGSDGGPGLLVSCLLAVDLVLGEG